MASKQCSCRFCEVKGKQDLNKFYRNITKSDGHNGICQACQAKVDKMNRKK